MSDGPRFDPTINLGHLITAATFLCTFVGGWYVFDYRLQAIEKQVSTLNTLVVDNARLDARVKVLERSPKPGPH